MVPGLFIPNARYYVKEQVDRLGTQGRKHFTSSLVYGIGMSGEQQHHDADDLKMPRPTTFASNLTQVRSSLAIIKEPNPFDVLLGRGRRHVSHPGNRRLQIVVNMNIAPYNASGCRQDKTRITQDIVNFVQSCGTQPGRFLKFESSVSGWSEVDDEVARVKVAQALRYSRRTPQDDLITRSMLIDDEKQRAGSASNSMGNERSSSSSSSLLSLTDSASKRRAMQDSAAPASLLQIHHKRRELLPQQAGNEASPTTTSRLQERREPLVSDEAILTALGYGSSSSILFQRQNNAYSGGVGDNDDSSSSTCEEGRAGEDEDEDEEEDILESCSGQDDADEDEAETGIPDGK